MTEQKIQELLGLLDRELPAFELWLYGHGIIKHHPTDESRIESFADLAFRLRDEAYEHPAGMHGHCWHEGKNFVREHFKMNERWFDDMAQPRHWIVAALIAKELAK